MTRRHAHRALCWLPILSALLVGTIGCGKKDLLSSEATFEDSSPVKGSVSLGTQCADGSIQDPGPHTLRLWSCPGGPSPAEFSAPPPALIFSVDCTKKVMTVHSPDRSVDFIVELRPNLSFSAWAEGGALHFQDDGTGLGPCVAFSSLGLEGQAHCENRDRVVAEMKLNWWPMLGDKPPSAVGRMGRLCRFAEGCTLSARPRLRQCGA